MRFLAGIVLSLAAVAAPALADEVWVSQHGPIVWETDIGTTAVLRLDDEESGVSIRLFVPGLAADVAGGRGTYTGVWVAPEGPDTCVTDMVDPVEEFASPHWGTFTLTFMAESYPSGWAGAFGPCLDLRTQPISATAIAAN